MLTEPIVFGTHDQKTLTQLADVASRAERAALMADGLRSQQVMSQAVAVGASDVAFGDLLGKFRPAKVAASPVRVAQVNPLSPPDMVKFHYFGRQLDTAIDARAHECSMKNRLDSYAPLFLIRDVFLSRLLYPIRASVVLAIIGCSRRFLLRTQLCIGLRHAAI